MSAALRWTLCLALLGCKRSPAPAPASAPADGDTARAATAPAETLGAAFAGVYRVVPVTQPGRVEGRVRWDGPRPALDPLTVGPGGNPSHCGASQPWPALSVSEGGGVRFAVVALDVSEGAAPTAREVLVNQEHCRYDPHVVALAVGDALTFGNADRGLLHNVHAYYGYDGDDNWFNAASPHGVPIVRRVLRPGVHRLLCDAGHTWMLGYVLAFRHPYFAVTDGEGAFAMEGVPPGTHRVHFWHEGWVASGREGNGRPIMGPAVEAVGRVEVPAGGRGAVRFVLSAAGARQEP